MKFNSNSVIVNGGKRLRLDVHIPAALLDIDIPDEIWQTAITNFNTLLNNHEKITVNVNSAMMDVIHIEAVTNESKAMEAVILLVIMQEDEYYKIENVEFRLKGHLMFIEQTGKIDSMVIENIIWGNSEKLLDFSVE
jgi:hypothetical protein